MWLPCHHTHEVLIHRNTFVQKLLLERLNHVVDLTKVLCALSLSCRHILYTDQMAEIEEHLIMIRNWNPIIRYHLEACLGQPGA